MSSRVRSDFGSLGERTTATPQPDAGKPGPLPRHCVVDSRHPGLLLSWDRGPSSGDKAGDWLGLVAYADQDCELHVMRLPASRLAPS